MDDVAVCVPCTVGVRWVWVWVWIYLGVDQVVRRQDTKTCTVEGE